MREIAGCHRTQRTLQNSILAAQAAITLKDACGLSHGDFDMTPLAARWPYLFAGDEGDYYSGGRKTILAGLGRVRSTDAILVFADRLNELRPSVRQAVEMLIKWRRRIADIAVIHLVAAGEDGIVTSEDFREWARKACGR
jgi:hypothetical protein